MPRSFAVFTTHPELLTCQLARLEGQLAFRADDPGETIGIGTFDEEEVLLRRISGEVALPSASALVERSHSEALLYSAQRLPPSRSVESAQPLRFRHWLFAFHGKVQAFPNLRQKLETELPGHLRRNLFPDTEGEAAFALFLWALRELGRTDDRTLEARVCAQVLGRTARELGRRSAEAGASRTSDLALFATNGHVLSACVLGQNPLSYTLLEGTDECAICGVDRATPPAKLSAQAHRRCRTVAVTSQAERGRWIELSGGQVLAIDATASVEQLAI